MYKNTSNNMQSRAGRVTMKDMPSGGVSLTLKDEYENGKKALNHIDRLLNGNLTDRERTELGKKKLALANRQCEVKKLIGKGKTKHHPENMHRHLTKAMSLLLSPVQVQEIVDLAKSFYGEATGKKPESEV